MTRENGNNLQKKVFPRNALGFAQRLKMLKHLNYACLGEPIKNVSLKTGRGNAHPAWPAQLPLIKVVMGRMKGP